MVRQAVRVPALVHDHHDDIQQAAVDILYPAENRRIERDLFRL